MLKGEEDEEPIHELYCGVRKFGWLSLSLSSNLSRLTN